MDPHHLHRTHQRRSRTHPRPGAALAAAAAPPIPGVPLTGPPPLARIDPLTTPVDALRVVHLARSWPPRDEVVAVLLDEAFRGTGRIAVMADRPRQHSELAVAEAVGLGELDVGADAITHALVLASIRLDARPRPLDDAEVWRRASDLCDDHDVLLVEWFVIGPDGVSFPRDALGEPSRWPRS